MKSLEGLKFGGSSVANSAAMIQSGLVVKSHCETGKALFVVDSAMEGVTDQLRDVIYNAVVRAASGRKSAQKYSLNDSGMYRDQPRKGETDLEKAIREGKYNEVLNAIAERHHTLINESVDTNFEKLLKLHKTVDETTAESNRHIASMVDLGEIHKGWLDAILGRNGEGLTAPIKTAHLLSHDIDAVLYNASEIIITDGIPGNANPLIGSIRNSCRVSGLEADLIKGRVVVIAGFMGSDIGTGYITTIGRGGTDTTTTALGLSLSVLFDDIAVYLYKADPKISAIMSGDHRIIEGTHSIDYLHFLEGSTLTALGGKVIHSKAVHYAIRSASKARKPFPIYVKSTVKPELPGTKIWNEIRPDNPSIKAVSVVMNGISVVIQGPGMDKPGITRKISEAFTKEGIDIAFIDQSSPLDLSLAFHYNGREKDDDFEAKLEERSKVIEKISRKVLEGDTGTSDIDSIEAQPASIVGIIGYGAARYFNLDNAFNRLTGSEFDKLKQPEAYRMASSPYGVSLLFNFRKKELIRAFAQAAHDSVFGN